MATYSQSRNESRIIQAVNTMIVNGEIKNPRLSTFASISHLTLSKDNAYCTLYVSCLDEGRTDACVEALQSASAFIQGKIGSLLKTKNTPKLTFRKDTVELEARKMEELLSSIRTDNINENNACK